MGERSCQKRILTGPFLVHFCSLCIEKIVAVDILDYRDIIKLEDTRLSRMGGELVGTS